MDMGSREDEELSAIREQTGGLVVTLTPERLDEIEQDPIEACLTDDEIIALVSAARANAKLVEALKELRHTEIRSQRLRLIDAALEAAGVKP